MTTLVAFFLIGLLKGASADFYYPDCEYAGLSCVTCDSQKQCINFFGSMTYWATLSCSSSVSSGYSSPYCNPDTNQCTGIRPAGCPAISNYKCIRNGMFPELNDCTVYYNCTDDGSEQFVCPDGYVYRQAYGKCVFQLSNDDCFTVTSCGLQNSISTYPGDASLYYTCTNSALKLTACANTEQYNATSGKCQGVCKSAGLLPYTQNCTEYITCGDDLTAELSTCQSGYGFNQNTGTCQQDYSVLCNELALLENDVTDAVVTIPIIGTFWKPILTVLNFFNVNPFTCILKFGLSEDTISTGILVVDYVYKYKTIPPKLITFIVRTALQFLPADIRAILETLIQLGILNVRSASENRLQSYLEDVLADVDVFALIGSFDGKNREEINAEITRGILRVFHVRDAQAPFFVRLLQMNVKPITTALNRQLGFPLLEATAQNEFKVNVVAVDGAVYDALDHVAARLYPADAFMAELFKSYAKQQYSLYHQQLVDLTNEAYFSFNIM